MAANEQGNKFNDPIKIADLLTEALKLNPGAKVRVRQTAANPIQVDIKNSKAPKAPNA